MESSNMTASDAKMNLGAGIRGAPATFMQGTGIALESDFAYDTYYEWMKTRGMSRDVENNTRFYSLARLSKWSLLGSPNTSYSGAEMSNGTNMTVIKRMKSALNDGKGVSITYKSNSATYSKYMNTEHYAQYINTKTSTDHDVCIVGYDDDYPVSNFNSYCRPPENGAFIVKNSYGSGWGDGGYFYLSYYDKTISTASTYEFDTSSYDGSTYIDNSKEVVDQYDYMQPNLIAYQASEWYSNIYTTFQKQQLHHIATYYSTPGVDMQYKVYRLKDDAHSPTDFAYDKDLPDAEGTYKSDYEGYVSIELDKPISLAKGEKYAIWFSGNAPMSKNVGPEGADQSGINWVSTAVINNAESFYYKDSKWNNYTYTGNGSVAYDNFCVKGYSTVQGDTSKVSFESNGGSTVTQQTITDGNTLEIPDNPTKEGATFVGWYIDKNLSVEYDFAQTITHDITLYAKWIDDCNITYKGLNQATNTNAQVITGSNMPYKLKDPVKTGYDFIGWTTDDGKSVTEINENTAKNISLTATWSPHEYSISYLNCTGASNTNRKFYTCETSTFSLTKPTRTGYDFKCWTDSGGKEVSTVKQGTTGNLTFTASWTPQTYSIKYMNITGATNPNVLTTFNVETSTIILKNPVKTGYVFDGWYEKQGQTTGSWGKKITQIAKGSTGNVTLYAKWKVNTLTMWRLYNRYTGEHFYTSNESEKQSLVKVGWRDEGVGWYAPTKDTSNVPVYRLYNRYVSGGDHHYTMSTSERDSLVQLGWSYEGVAWYSCVATDINAKPLYRQYNPYASTGTHNYTLSTTELNKLVKAGWKDEGKAWYGYDGVE